MPVMDFPHMPDFCGNRNFGIADNAERFRTHWRGTADLYLPDGHIPRDGQLIKNPAIAAMFEYMIAEERRRHTDRVAGL